MYLDANNLYGWAMTQPLPLNSFQWHDPDTFDLSMLGSEKGKGYILEIDCEIPDIHHDKLNEYPPAPEKNEGYYSHAFAFTKENGLQRRHCREAYSKPAP